MPQYDYAPCRNLSGPLLKCQRAISEEVGHHDLLAPGQTCIRDMHAGKEYPKASNLPPRSRLLFAHNSQRTGWGRPNHQDGPEDSQGIRATNSSPFCKKVALSQENWSRCGGGPPPYPCLITSFGDKVSPSVPVGIHRHRKKWSRGGVGPTPWRTAQPSRLCRGSRSSSMPIRRSPAYYKSPPRPFQFIHLRLKLWPHPLGIGL